VRWGFSQYVMASGYEGLVAKDPAHPIATAASVLAEGQAAAAKYPVEERGWSQHAGVR
jgi:hypothetical protein